MNKYYYRFICAAIMTVIVVSSFTYVWVRFVERNNQTGHLTGVGNILMAIAIYTFLFIIVGTWLKAFKIGVERKAKLIASGVLTIFISNLIEVLISMAITGQFRFFDSFLVRYLLLAVCQSIVVAVMMVLMVNLYRKIIPPLTLLEVVGEHPNNLSKELNSLTYKYHVMHTVYYNDSGLTDQIQDYDAVLINDIPSEYENNILKQCFARNKRVYVLPKLSDIILKSSEDINLVDTPLFLCKNLGIRKWQAVIKRAFDLIISVLALIILSPVFLFTAIAIKLNDGGPVFYKQERVTLHERRFMIIKFRSMVVDAEKDGRPHPTGENDSRITKVGRVIRPTRIDELPQLFNIIKGDMSIVGPRPERFEHVEKFQKEIPEFEYRHKVKGGLTGYAQVYGKYNTSALDKLKMDLIYITNYHLFLDVQIIFETLKIVFMRDRTEGFSEELIKEIHDDR